MPSDADRASPPAAVPRAPQQPQPPSGCPPSPGGRCRCVICRAAITTAGAEPPPPPSARRGDARGGVAPDEACGGTCSGADKLVPPQQTSAVATRGGDRLVLGCCGHSVHQSCLDGWLRAELSAKGDAAARSCPLCCEGSAEKQSPSLGPLHRDRPTGPSSKVSYNPLYRPGVGSRMVSDRRVRPSPHAVVPLPTLNVQHSRKTQGAPATAGKQPTSPTLDSLRRACSALTPDRGRGGSPTQPQQRLEPLVRHQSQQERRSRESMQKMDVERHWWPLILACLFVAAIAVALLLPLLPSGEAGSDGAAGGAARGATRAPASGVGQER